MENLNYLDAVLGGIVILSTLIGLARGLVKEVLSLVAWLAAVYVAWMFAERVANDYIREFIDDPLISYLAAFGLIFISVLFIVGLVNLIITQLLVPTGLSAFNRFLGMFFGLARGLLIGALVVFVLNLTPLKKENWWKESRLVPGFESVGDWAWAKLPQNVRDLLRDGGEQVSNIGTHITLPKIQTEDTGQSSMAERPSERAPKEQRNAISDLGQGTLQLESVTPDNDGGKQPDSDDDSRLNILPSTPLQLESTQ